MIYAISDIHGCYDKLIQMIDKISLSESDKLILAGDYIDRGEQSLEMLLFLENHSSNIIPLKGNHDCEFSANIELIKSVCNQNNIDYNKADSKSADIYHLTSQLLDSEMFDYYGTIQSLIEDKSVSLSQLVRWGEMIDNMDYYYRTTINDRDCVIVHAGFIESLEGVETEDHYSSIESFYLYARDDSYFCGGVPKGMIVAGHTPTIAPEELPYNEGKVYRFYDEELDCIFYDIDCGCAYPSGQLACLRLEDEAIYYI